MGCLYWEETCTSVGITAATSKIKKVSFTKLVVEI